MANVSWLPPIVVEASGRLMEALNLAELTQGSTVWLAVTGLSRSGKTVFITSLVHNLLSALHNPSRLPLLRVVGEGRLTGARIEGARAERLPRFPYAGNIDAMAAGAPHWPERTEGISEIGLELQFAPTGTVGRILDTVGAHHGKLSVRIVDYPGEWLLDLPLMDQGFAEWSRAILRLYRTGIRAAAARDFFALIAQHPHDETASDETARQAHDAYRAFLCK